LLPLLWLLVVKRKKHPLRLQHPLRHPLRPLRLRLQLQPLLLMQLPPLALLPPVQLLPLALPWLTLPRPAVMMPPRRLLMPPTPQSRSKLHLVSTWLIKKATVRWLFYARLASALTIKLPPP
jgi:hypothetical protein